MAEVELTFEEFKAVIEKSFMDGWEANRKQINKINTQKARERRESDPEYMLKKQAYWRSMSSQEDRAIKSKLRYANDPEFRSRSIARSRAYTARKRDEREGR